ncbi:MAG: transporter, partial [Flavobacteriaceae bacterium]|nr:transporter [Flavobacteriaceae bacterium]
FNKLAKFDVILPYSTGNYNALVNEEKTSVTRNGFADPLFRLSLLLVGVKPLKPQDYFKQMQKRFKLGVVFRLRAPLGNYNSSQLLNIGSNRWSFKTGIAGSYTFKRVVLEGHLNSWFFTTNNDFFNGNINKQKALFGVQVHATYIFKPGIWLALSTGKTFGGKTEINGVEQDVTQNNSRFGLAFAYRINKNNGLKIAYTNGFITRSGADFNTLVLAYQFMWFDKN